jgi:hypothetical protein
MSDKEKLEDETPETVTETPEDDSADVEGHGHFKYGADGHSRPGNDSKGAEGVLK